MKTLNIFYFQGEFGIVIKGEFCDINNKQQTVAIKKLNAAHITDKMKEAFMQEVDNLARAEHERVVRFHGFMTSPGNNYFLQLHVHIEYSNHSQYISIHMKLISSELLSYPQRRHVHKNVNLANNF